MEAHQSRLSYQVDAICISKQEGFQLSPKDRLSQACAIMQCLEEHQNRSGCEL